MHPPIGPSIPTGSSSIPPVSREDEEVFISDPTPPTNSPRTPTPPPRHKESNNSSNISEENNRLVVTGEKESGKEDSFNNKDQHKERKKIIIYNEEAPSSSSNNILLSYDENVPEDLEENIAGEIKTETETETDVIERQQVNSFVNLGASSSGQEHASDGVVDAGEMVSGEVKDVINKTENTPDIISTGSTVKPFINTFVNIGSEYSPGLQKIKTTMEPLINIKSSSPTIESATTKLFILPKEEQEHSNYNSAEPGEITDYHHLAGFEAAHDLQSNYFSGFMNNIRSHIRNSAQLTTSTQPSTTRSTTTTSTTSLDYISSTTRTLTDDVDILNAEKKTGLFQMIEDGKNLLKTLLSNYFSTFITAIQSIWCNLVQNTSELFQSFVSKNAQNYLEETAKMFKC